MKVIAPKSYMYVVPLGRGVKAGEVVDVDDTVAADLLAQGWTERKRRGGLVPTDTEIRPDGAPTEE